MISKLLDLRQDQLDAQFEQINDLPMPPEDGWISTIREALGISLRTLGERLGVTRSSVKQLELAEADGSITVNRLRSAADALGCDLYVLVIPRKPLRQMALDQAESVAQEAVESVSHSMALEGQAISEERKRLMVREHAAELLRGSPRKLWD